MQTIPFTPLLFEVKEKTFCRGKRGKRNESSSSGLFADLAREYKNL